jgi:2-polyprenyl-6-hydroxyphenyl methylase/3-demethylubiquinone-9 3-methyltransferase
VRARDLTDVETHFKFGENWASFARLIDAERIALAVSSLQELVGPDLSGKSFLDIGCGSGLSSLAAAKLGAKPILATDIDPRSVETTIRLLSSSQPTESFRVRTISVFDLGPAEIGHFDVVYSWGVLHHTGAMWRAIEHAATFTKPDGIFVLAIYNKTPLCGLWRLEKSIYSRASRPTQRWILTIYRAALYAAQLIRLRNPWHRAAMYKVERGMDQEHDFHDWLGGYPYESATPDEIRRFLSARGFRLQHAQRLKRARLGLFGTGCAEYVFRRFTEFSLSESDL